RIAKLLVWMVSSRNRVSRSLRGVHRSRKEHELVHAARTRQLALGALEVLEDIVHLLGGGFLGEGGVAAAVTLLRQCIGHELYETDRMRIWVKGVGSKNTGAAAGFGHHGCEQVFRLTTQVLADFEQLW